MAGACCPECGHLLSIRRDMCPFCHWEEESDRPGYSLKVENTSAYLDLNQLGRDHVLSF
jgi:hypothetical protein